MGGNDARGPQRPTAQVRCPPIGAHLSLHKTKKRHNSLRYNLLCRYELRRQDSNMRPPGYEPGELPTAPLRDVVFVSCLRVQS